MSMKLTIKTLKQISYQVEVGLDATVKGLKEEIESKHGLDSKSIKLLFNGTVLEDAKSLNEIGVKDGHVLMMMNVKAKPQNQQIKEEKKEEESLPNSNQTVKKKENESTIINKDYNSEIKQLTEMGFSQENSRNAIVAAKGNVSLAIEYLYNGIPSVNPQFSEFYDEDEEGEYEPIELDQELLNNLDLTNPETLKTIASVLKVIIQEDPSQLTDLLEGIEETNPELIDFIKQNENEFKSLIQQPVNEQDIRVFESLGGVKPEDDNSALSDEELTDMNNAVQLSENDKESIQRLKNLGFSEEEALQAYIVCEKNETLAANFLLENKYKEAEMNIDCNFN